MNEAGGGSRLMDLERGGTTPHGQKRRAQEELSNDQRLVKRFNLLNLDHNGKLYTAPHLENSSSGANGYEDSMQMDDTKDKVYIYNLDDELRAVDEGEEKLVFLPDIDRKLNKIPKSLLRGHGQPLANSEVVLYRVPSSLSIPQEHDNVRKAIIESRARARQRQLDDAKPVQDGITTPAAPMNGLMHQERHQEHHSVSAGEDYDDVDAMDLG